MRVRLVLAPQMPREGPCRVEGCKDPENWSGQWQYIPEEYCDENGLVFREACTCKKAAPGAHGTRTTRLTSKRNHIFGIRPSLTGGG